MHRAISLLAASLAAVSAAAGEEAEKEPVPTPEKPFVGVVTVDRLNVRKGPGRGYDILGQFGTGDEVVVRHVQGKWYEVDCPEKLPVWINAKYVKAAGEVGAASLDAPVAGVVTKSGVRLRNRPSLRGVILDERQKDDEVRVAGSAHGWYRIVPPEDMRCYLYADYVDLVKPREAAPADEPQAEDVLPLELASPRAPAEIEEPPEEAAAPGEVMDRVGLADELLSGTPSLEDAERALRLLERALASREPGIRERAKDVLGGVAPGVWLSLFEKARIDRERKSADIARRGGDRLRGPADEVEYTARGVLRVPAQGTGRHRLTHGETLLYELQPEIEGADLAPFVGKGVGVIGDVRSADRPGEPPWILVCYVEELADSPASGPAPGPDARSEQKRADETGGAGPAAEAERLGR